MTKESAFEVSEVVNWLLLNYESDQYQLTNLKLNKVVYFIHGVSLAREGRALVRNRFECWKNGPVIASLYHRLKKFGSDAVTEPICYTNYETGNIETVSSDRVELLLTAVGRRAADYFVNKSTSWLVSQSHVEDGPWFRNYMKSGSDSVGIGISDLEIKEHFTNIYGGKQLH